jgi:hypothetical protein
MALTGTKSKQQSEQKCQQMEADHGSAATADKMGSISPIQFIFEGRNRPGLGGFPSRQNWTKTSLKKQAKYLRKQWRGRGRSLL